MEFRPYVVLGTYEGANIGAFLVVLTHLQTRFKAF